MATILIKLSGAEKYAVLARRLRAAGSGELQRQLNRNIRIAGKPALTAVRDAVRGVEVSSSRGGGKKSTGLRDRIANATQIDVAARGIRIRVVGKKVDPKYGRSLSRLMNDTNKRPWVHPVFGNQEKQATQRGQDYFASAILPFAPEFRQACEDAMDEIAARIEGRA